MRFRPAVVVVVLLLALSAFAATERNWQTGMLMESEQLKVPSNSTKTSSTDGTAKPKGDKTQYSEQTTTTTQDYDTFQVFTIEGDTKIYTVRQRLLFPWSKPANIVVGEKVKYAIEKNTMYLQDDDGKEAKTSIVKVKMKSGQ